MFRLEKLLKLAAIGLLALFTTSCRTGTSTSRLPDDSTSYARGFILTQVEGNPTLSVYDSRQRDTTQPLCKYQIGGGSFLSDTLVVLPKHPERIVCLSSTHIAFLAALGLDSCIVGVSTPEHITNPTVRARFAEGKIKDVGMDINLNYEAIIALQPEVVFAYAVSGPKPAFVGRLQQAGIPVVMLSEFLETHPLGRAEWVRAIGMLVGKEATADSLFEEVATRYQQLTAMVDTVSQRPTVLLNAPWQEIWYIPGGETYLAKLIKDAGAIPLSGGHDHDTQSHPMNLEAVLAMGLEADYWLNPGTFTNLQELGESNAIFKQFRAFQKGCIWNNTARSTPAGGNDFWESGVLAPDEALADLIAIFHPSLLPEHGQRYHFKLKP